MERSRDIVHNYAATMLRDQAGRGPSPREDFYRLQVSGNGQTPHVNITPAQLDAIAAILDTSSTALETPTS